MAGLRTSIGLLVAVLAATLAPSSAASAAALPCSESGFDVIVLRTFTVDVKSMAPSYKIGQAAKVAVKVTRPAPQDPLQAGVHVDLPASTPADGVVVGVGLHIGPVFAPGYGKTDKNGKVTVSIGIPRYAKPGTVNVDAYAYNVLVQVPCYTLQEDGFTHKNGVFQATR